MWTERGTLPLFFIISTLKHFYLFKTWHLFTKLRVLIKDELLTNDCFYCCIGGEILLPFLLQIREKVDVAERRVGIVWRLIQSLCLNPRWQHGWHSRSRSCASKKREPWWLCNHNILPTQLIVKFMENKNSGNLFSDYLSYYFFSINFNASSETY